MKRRKLKKLTDNRGTNWYSYRDVLIMAPSVYNYFGQRRCYYFEGNIYPAREVMNLIDENLVIKELTK